MKNAIILHGKPDKKEYYDASVPSCSNFHWLPWLQKQLLVRDIHAYTPEIPKAWQPEYSLWKKEFERYEITPETLLTGHSCGGGFLVRWLSENPDRQVGKVVLVAPSLGLDWKHTGFFDFDIDPALAARTKGLVIFASTDDRPAILEAAAKLRNTIANSEYREFTDHGHFTLRRMGTEKFPELLDALIS